MIFKKLKRNQNKIKSSGRKRKIFGSIILLFTLLFIIVRKLTKEIIEEAVKAYAENNAYWLKFYHFAGEVNTAVFNRLQAEHTEYLKELDELDNS
jgi:lipoprotein signal peptidase